MDSATQYGVVAEVGGRGRHPTRRVRYERVNIDGASVDREEPVANGLSTLADQPQAHRLGDSVRSVHGVEPVTCRTKML